MATEQRIPLSASFRFVHEPLGTTGTGGAGRFVGRQAELAELVSRILLSEGGAFLITGYRGVGKSSFVNQAIAELGRQLFHSEGPAGPSQLVDVYLNFARPVTAAELMFHVLRSLRHRLQELDLLGRVPSDLREELDLACQRTSVSISSSIAVQSERSLQLGDVPLRLPFTTLGAPLQFGLRRSSQRGQELAYLAYDDKAAEYDLIRLARRLTHGFVTVRRRWPWPLHRASHAAGTRTALKVIFIFDELDKLDEGRDAGGGSALDDILGNLKTLFTTSGITFLFVAGRGLHDRLLEDVGRGDSIYESVFTYARYLPALWQHADAMCDLLVATDAAGPPDDAAATYLAFKKYLAFKGRGIPRRILRGFNEQVRWDGTRAALVFTAADRRRYRFYAGVYDVLSGGEERLLGRVRSDNLSEQRDRQRLALYYLTDWILQRGSWDFSIEDAVAASRRLSRVIAPIEESAPQLVNALVDLLIDRDYLEEAPADGRAQIVEDGRSALPASRYRVTRRRMLEIGGEAGAFDLEAEALQREDRDVPGDRYSVLRTLGRGGMSDVLLAVDTRTGRTVAIKRLRTDVEVPELYDRFRREAQILRELRHPGIVELIDVSIEAVPPFIVMEYVEGLTLADLIRRRAFRGIDDVVAIARQLAQVLDYLHDRGVIWRDAKPANIVLTREGRIVLLDFGIARRAGPGAQPGAAAEGLTQHGSIVGTVGYMSPEALRGEMPDRRSDLYGLGVMLYEMLVGRPPFETGSMTGYVRILTEPPPPPSALAPVPEWMDVVVTRLLATDPAQRFQTAREFLEACPASRPVDLASLGRVAAAREEAEAERENLTTRLVSPTVIASFQTGGRPPGPARAPAAAPVPVAAAPVPETVMLPAPPRPSVPPPPVAAAVEAPRLRLPDGSEIPLGTERVTVGRSHENAIVLDEGKASRFQAVLLRTPGGFTIEDLNSVNGTLLNGRRLTEAVPLNDGDQIVIGGTVLTYLS